MNFLENEFFLLAITFGIFFLAKLLQKKTGIMLLAESHLTDYRPAYHFPEDDKYQL